ncbi:MAG: hypothetical protein WB368_10920, partial [Candidatus Sulfotelmatobacter sp.]
LPTSFVVNRGSAGLGISRGSVSNLHYLNSQVAKTGWVHVEAAQQFSASSARGGEFGRSGENTAMRAGGVGHTGATASGHSSGGTGGGHR